MSEEIPVVSALEVAESLAESVTVEEVAGPMEITIEVAPVYDRATATMALRGYAALKREIKDRKDAWAEVKRSARSVYDLILAAEKLYFEKAETILGELYDEIVGFEREDRARVKSEQTAAHELAEVHKEESGAPFSAAPVVTPEFPTELAPMGLTRRDGWEAEVTDEEAFRKAYREGRLPEGCMVPATAAAIAKQRDLLSDSEWEECGVSIQPKPTYALKKKGKK